LAFAGNRDLFFTIAVRGLQPEFDGEIFIPGTTASLIKRFMVVSLMQFWPSYPLVMTLSLTE
jgi:hypothetical protein